MKICWFWGGPNGHIVGFGTDPKGILEFLNGTVPLASEKPVLCSRNKNCDDFSDFLEEWQLCQSLLWKFNVTLVLILSREALQ